MRRLRVLLLALCALLLGPAPGAFADCTNPAAPEGVMLYNADENVPQFCDGTAWIRMAPPAIGLPVDNSLVGWWKLDEASGTLADSSGNGNDGTQSGGVGYASAGIIGTALYFDGSDDAVSIPHHSSLSPTDWTISGWFKVDGPGSGAHKVIAKSPVDVSTEEYEMDFNEPENSLRCSFNNSDPAQRTPQINDSVSYGVWYHGACVYDSTANTLTAYLDGAFLADLDTTGVTPPSTSTAVFIGRSRNGGSHEFLKGNIDDVRIYNRALSPEEIARCCVSIPADKGDYTSNLVGWWKLDETAGTTANDSAGSNDGTMEGGLDAANNSVTGTRDTALEFDGTDDRVTATDQPYFSPVNNNITVSLWANVPPDAPATTNGSCNSDGNIIMAKIGGTGPEWEFQIDNNDVICFGMYTLAQGGHANVSKSMTVNDGQWHHYVATVDYNTEVILYVDGEWADTDTTFGSAMGDGTGAVSFGQRDGMLETGYFAGTIDDARIYDRALTAADVKALYLDSAKYCENPDGVPGQLYHNEDTHAPMYCDGDQWVDTGQDSLARGLVGHWKLDEASGALADSSGNGNDGTESGGVGYASAGMIGTALNFDGVDDKILTSNANSVKGLSQATISLWFKPELLDGTVQRLYYECIAADCTLRLNWVIHGDNELRLVARVPDANGSATVLVNDNRSLQTGVWYHAVAVIDAVSDVHHIYLNGDGLSNSAALDAFDGTDPIYPPSIGAISNAGSGSPFRGSIDDVRFYDRALSAAEVTALYKHGLADDGLIAYWPLDDEDGGTIATDMQGGHIGYASGGVTFSSAGGQVRGSATFDGIDGYIWTPHNPALSGFSQMTVTAWINPTGPVSASWEHLVSKDDGDTSCDYCLGWRPSGEISFRLDRFGGGHIHANTTTVITENTGWHFLAGVYDGTDVHVYYNGTLEDTTSFSYTPKYTGFPLAIGSNYGDPADRTFEGSIDDVRIYNRALSAEEIAEIYAAGAGGLAAQDCTNPNGAEGAIIYNLDESAPQYCDGARWVRMGGP